MNLANTNEIIVAKRYALAFLNFYGHKIVLDNMQAYSALYNYLDDNSGIVFFLYLPGLDQEAQESGLLELCERFGLHSPIDNLINIICSVGRGFYIKNIVGKIIAEAQKRDNQEKFMVTSSHVLSDESSARIAAFLARHTGHHVVVESIIDRSLIAGVRVKSDTHFWEQSIARTVARIK